MNCERCSKCDGDLEAGTHSPNCCENNQNHWTQLSHAQHDYVIRLLKVEVSRLQSVRLYYSGLTAEQAREACQVVVDDLVGQLVQ